MRRTVSRTNQFLSILLVALGLALVWAAIQKAGFHLNANMGLGIVLVVYGITRHILYSKYGHRDE